MALFLGKTKKRVFPSEKKDLKMKTEDQKNVTLLLKKMAEGNRSAESQLMLVVYNQLYKMALRKMSGESRQITLQPTVLVHEAYFKLMGQHSVDWKSKSQFYALAAEMMRRIIIDHARKRQADKRGGECVKVSFEEEFHSSHSEEKDLNYVLDLNSALEKLCAENAQVGKIVELKFFGGFNNKEIADILDVSQTTVKRGWSFAKAYLGRELDQNKAGINNERSL